MYLRDYAKCSTNSAVNSVNFIIIIIINILLKHIKNLPTTWNNQFSILSDIKQFMGQEKVYWEIIQFEYSAI